MFGCKERWDHLEAWHCCRLTGQKRRLEGTTGKGYLTVRQAMVLARAKVNFMLF